MNNVSIFNVYSAKENQIEFKCPSCGSLCDLKSKRCDECGYTLKDYKSIVLSRYVYFNNAIDYLNKGDYFNALLEVKSFITLIPSSESGNELYAYLLYKNNREIEYQKQLDYIENTFKFSNFIMNVEKDGIDNYKIPNKIELDIDFYINSFDELMKMYEKNNFKSINDILEFIQGFYELYQSSKDKSLKDFYNKRFLQFLSKQGITLDTKDGKKYDDLSDDEKKSIDVKGSIESKKPLNTLVTVFPAVYLKDKLIVKEQTFIVKRTKRW